MTRGRWGEVAAFKASPGPVGPWARAARSRVREPRRAKDSLKELCLGSSGNATNTAKQEQPSAQGACCLTDQALSCAARRGLC